MKSTVLSLTGLVFAVIGITIAMKVASATGVLELVNDYTTSLGALGFVAFVVASGVATIFFFPGSFVMTASGAAFGLVWGFVAAQAATTLGAALAFIVSRYVARSHVERWASSRPRFSAVDAAIGEEGWKIVTLTRCCPVFPYIFQNYAYGLTRVRLDHYTLGSFIGLVPSTLLFVYVGALGRDAAAGGNLELALRVVGLAATVVVSIYLTRVSTRALEKVGL